MEQQNPEDAGTVEVLELPAADEPRPDLRFFWTVIVLLSVTFVGLAALLALQLAR